MCDSSADTTQPVNVRKKIHKNKQNRKDKMKEEVHCACEFLSRMLETRNLPIQFVTVFKKRLEELLLTRFKNHWDTANPSKGSAYRCIRINGRLDPVIRDAAKVTGLSDISTYLPAEFTMWIDPREVSYRFGEEGSICNCSLDSMRENASTPPEWQQLRSSTTTTSYHTTAPSMSRSSGYPSPVGRSRTSPVPRRSPNGKYSPTPTSNKRSQSPPLHYAAYESAHSNTSGYPTGFPYNYHRLDYVIPVHV